MNSFPTKEQLFEHDGYRLVAEISRYAMGNTPSVLLYTYGYDIDEPYAHVTVNLDDSLKEQLFFDPSFFKRIKGSYPVQFVDINNSPWLPEFLIKNDIAEPVYDGHGEPVTADSGHVEGYPLFRFFVDKFWYIYDIEEELDES